MGLINGIAFFTFLIFASIRLSSAAVISGETAAVAGATAGAIIVPPVIAQALTGSKVEVTIEAYTETIPLSKPKELSVEGWLRIPPDERRSTGFFLGGPSVLYRLTQQ